MLDDIDVSRTIPAWVQESGSGGSAPRASGKPQLMLHVVQDDGSLLLVEVAEGIARPVGTMLWLGGRGAYEVALVLHRTGGTWTRSYMRLRGVRLPRAA